MTDPVNLKSGTNRSFLFRHSILSLAFISLFVFTNCAHIHYFGYSPMYPGKYPVFTSHDTLIGKADTDRAGYDVTSYDLNLRLSPEDKSIGGIVIMRFRALLPLGVLRFDLYPNMNLISVRSADNDLLFTRKDRAVYVSLKEHLIPGRDYSFLISYNGKPVAANKPPWEGGTIWKKDKKDNPWCGVAVETDGASLWFPCKEHISDEPDSVRLKMEVPKGLVVVSNGLMNEHIQTDSSEVYTWSTHYPINPYNITYYVGKFETFSDTVNTNDGIINVNYWVLPEDLEKAKTHFIQTKDILRFYSNTFGQYPWIKEDFKLVGSPFAGMEHQTAIAYGNHFVNYKPFAGDYIIIHETAHEWWGNAVTVSDFSDIWLQEGFATFCEMLWSEHKLGMDNAYSWKSYYYGAVVINKRPVVGPRDVNYWDYKDGDVYVKGALILHTLRNLINNNPLFMDILRTFYSEHAKGTHVTTSDFIKLVERKTGKNWDWFFNVYLYQSQIPELNYYFSLYTGKTDSSCQYVTGIPFIVAKWTGVPEGFTMPVLLNCRDEKINIRINVTTSAQIFYLNGLKSQPSVSINPNLSYYGWDQLLSVLKEFEKSVGISTEEYRYKKGARFRLSYGNYRKTAGH